MSVNSVGFHWPFIPHLDPSITGWSLVQIFFWSSGVRSVVAWVWILKIVYLSLYCHNKHELMWNSAGDFHNYYPLDQKCRIHTSRLNQELIIWRKIASLSTWKKTIPKPHSPKVKKADLDELKTPICGMPLSQPLDKFCICIIIGYSLLFFLLLDFIKFLARRNTHAYH